MLSAGELHVLMSQASKDKPSLGRNNHEAGYPALRRGSYLDTAATTGRSCIGEPMLIPYAIADNN